MNIIRPVVLTLCVVLFSCNQANSGKKKKDSASAVSASKRGAKVSLTKRKRSYAIGDSVYVKFRKRGKYSVDSIVMFVGDRRVSAHNENKILSSSLKGVRVGIQRLKLKVYSGTDVYRASTSIRIFSDVEPQKLNYKIVKTYKHNPKFYTQGLVYENGHLYEGTGQKGESLVRKSKLGSEKAIAEKFLANNLFGEGIALTDKHVYQLTWQSNRGFKYNKKDLSLIDEFRFNTEGWGLTTIKDKLLMSDGTAILRVLNPANFDVERKFTVANNIGFVKNLNELEYVDGTIYANVYLQSYIVLIDENSGKVIGKLSLDELVPEKYRGDNDNVLNGIAYIPERKTFLVTGKRWSKMYEIKISN